MNRIAWILVAVASCATLFVSCANLASMIEPVQGPLVDAGLDALAKAGTLTAEQAAALKTAFASGGWAALWDKVVAIVVGTTGLNLAAVRTWRGSIKARKGVA